MPSSSTQNSGEPAGLLRTLASAFLGVLFGIFWSKLKSPIEKRTVPAHPQASSDDSRKKTEPPLPTRVVIESYPQPPITEQEETDRTWRNRREWGNFVATWLTALGALGLLIVTSKYAYYTYKMWGEMETQTKTARQQLEVTARPWIKITEAKPEGNGPVIPALYFRPFMFDRPAPNAGHLNFTLGMKNVGHSVAEVSLKSELYIPPWEKFGQMLPEEKKRFCSSPHGEEWYPSVMLFPDEPPYQWRQEGVNFVESSSGARLNGQQIVALALIVCVDYRIRSAPARYQTSAVYDVLPQGGGKLRLFQLDAKVPADQLRLERNPLHDDAY